jgi:hypothetical protein
MAKSKRKLGNIKKVYSSLDKEKPTGFSESWEVNFWIKEDESDEFWKKKSLMYFTENKGMSEYVMNQWLKDFQYQPVTLINIIYQ